MAMAACLTMTRTVAAGPVGACCMPCECLQTDEESCSELGGFWKGPETDCLMCPTIPLFGACCLPDGTCSELSVLCCFDSGGVFQGDGVSCTPDPCLGACCLAVACEDGLSELLCADLGGEHQGVGTECPAPGGEDCNENGEDDAIDIYCGTSLDEDSNGIPDECEQCVSDEDCNDGDPCTIETCDEGVCIQEDLSPCCGNGVIEAGEECDPPDGVTCDADCQLILCGPDAECCCCPDAGCSAIDPFRCADMNSTTWCGTLPRRIFACG